MTKYLTHFFLACSFAIFSDPILMAQNAPITTVAIVGEVVAGAVSVPLTVTGFNNIGAVSLSLNYDYSVLHFTGGTPNPLLQSFPIGDLDLGTGYHRITMSWFGSGVSLADGSAVMTLSFTYINGITALAWHDNGPSCEYADAAYNVLNDIPTSTYFINGNVCGIIGDPGTIAGNNTLCRGQTGEAYSVAPVINATGYAWSCPEGAIIITGQNTNAITVDFLDNAVSGNISVYGINDCGNGALSELPVTVNILPAANAGNDTTINYGTSTTLHAAPGGTGIFSYHWSPEALFVDPNVQDPQTVILTTTSFISLIVINQNTFCQNTDNMTVTIAGGPLSVNPVSIPSSVCQGEYSQLYSNAGGGSGNYAFQWSSDPPGSPPWSSTLANPIVLSDSSRHYLLTVYDGFTTVSGTTFISALPLPTATISGGDTLCGENVYTELQVDLTGIPPWSFTYSYGSTSVFITDQQTSPYLIITSAPEDYTITVIEDANCSGSSYGMAIVRKYPVPATPEITLYGNELISSSCCGNQWYMNDIAIPGETGQTFHATVSGLYFVIITLNSCSSEPSEVVDMIVGISENNAGSFYFYPNPAHDKVNIQTTQNINSKLNVSLCSANGIVIKTYYFKDEGNVFTIDITNLSSGLYFLMFSNNDIHSVGKLIVK